MPPGNSGLGARLRHDAGKYRVAEQAFTLVQFTGIDVWLTSVSRGIDQELGLLCTQSFGQDSQVGIVQVLPPNIPEWYSVFGEKSLVRLSDIT
jgi:hypothetical protein